MVPEGAANNCGYPANLSEAFLGADPLKLAGCDPNSRGVGSAGEGRRVLRHRVSPVVALSFRWSFCHPFAPPSTKLVSV